MRKRTTVGIVGAGPAGLALGTMLLKAGIDCVVLERHSRSYVEQRTRAGLIEHRTVGILERAGLADGLRAHGKRHVGCEFRYGGRRFSVPYGSLTGNAAHYAYPQQLLVRDMIAEFLARGGELHFETEVTGIAGVAEERPRLVVEQDGTRSELECDIVAGCDGSHGPTRRALPAGAVREHVRQYPYRWLTVLADAPPSTSEAIYAVHEDGFAGHMLRTAEVSRFYLQCAPGETPDDWPDDRIWQELRHRLEIEEDWRLTEGPITEKRLLEMRTYVTAPMRFGNVHLLGDAAHVITPAGGKGMNLAIGDAHELAQGVIDWRQRGDRRRLDAFSDTRLRQIWRCQKFSDWLLHLINRPPGAGDRAGDPAVTDSFAQQMQAAQLDELRTDEAMAHWFAGSYVGAAL
ncbi:4-hydroxybenzoate 3-monooxygenase [Streptomyces sp. URMC 127]|uniref:4-hydroxybenzoate 3-monooxygenase n=1 Tax=Streptomyces sp. URMC 127 TaxID=3423402 RepID=UPI003F1BBE84